MTSPAHGTPDDADLLAAAVEDAFATGESGSRPSLLRLARNAANNVGEFVVNVGGSAADAVSTLDGLGSVVKGVGHAAGAIGDAAGAIGETAGTVVGAIGETAGTVVGAIGDAVSGIDLDLGL
jgi:hypothetical protein